MPKLSPIRIMCQIRTVPVAISRASVPCSRPRTVSVTTITARRGRTAAITPAEEEEHHGRDVRGENEGPGARGGGVGGATKGLAATTTPPPPPPGGGGLPHPAGGGRVPGYGPSPPFSGRTERGWGGLRRGAGGAAPLPRQMFQTWKPEIWPAGQPVFAVMFSRK